MSIDTDSVNFFRDKSTIVDPYPYLDAMRAQCPVQREPHHGVYMITGFDEATQVYNDTETFSACISVTGPFPGFPVPLEGDDISSIIEEYRDGLPFSDQLPTMDPPKHTDHRSLLMRLITPKRLKENEEFMWRLCERQMAPWIDSGKVEYINGFGTPFAMLVVADLLGVPESDHQSFKDALLAKAHEGGIGSTTDEHLGHSPLEYLYGRFTDYIEDRRANPRDDVMSGLATAAFPDGTMPEVIDVVRIASNLFAAGQETTVRLLSTAVMMIAEDPELQAALRADRSLIPNFVEECLRMESPVKGDFRIARRATEVGGVHLPAGTMVMLLNAGANRDPRKFEDPNTFDVHRATARQHMAFGRGNHTCPGAPLARAEAVVSLNRLLDRAANIRIDESVHGPKGARDYHYVPTFILRGVTRLFVEFDPVAG